MGKISCARRARVSKKSGGSIAFTEGAQDFYQRARTLNSSKFNFRRWEKYHVPSKHVFRRKVVGQLHSLHISLIPTKEFYVSSKRESLIPTSYIMQAAQRPQHVSGTGSASETNRRRRHVTARKAEQGRSMSYVQSHCFIIAALTIPIRASAPVHPWNMNTHPLVMPVRKRPLSTAIPGFPCEASGRTIERRLFFFLGQSFA
jgi:hypothetical protein